VIENPSGARWTKCWKTIGTPIFYNKGEMKNTLISGRAVRSSGLLLLEFASEQNAFMHM